MIAREQRPLTDGQRAALKRLSRAAQADLDSGDDGDSTSLTVWAASLAYGMLGFGLSYLSAVEKYGGNLALMSGLSTGGLVTWLARAWFLWRSRGASRKRAQAIVDRCTADLDHGQADVMTIRAHQVRATELGEGHRVLWIDVGEGEVLFLVEAELLAMLAQSANGGDPAHASHEAEMHEPDEHDDQPASFEPRRTLGSVIELARAESGWVLAAEISGEQLAIESPWPSDDVDRDRVLAAIPDIETAHMFAFAANWDTLADDFCQTMQSL